MKKVLVLNGPNLNRLATREPEKYGAITLNILHNNLMQQAEQANLHLNCIQTNSETQFIETIHQAADEQVDFLIINAAAYTHTSIAIRDALLACQVPFIEVHISNIYAREAFRHHSYLSDIAQGIICGLGVEGYYLALQAIISKFSAEKN